MTGSPRLERFFIKGGTASGIHGEIHHDNHLGKKERAAEKRDSDLLISYIEISERLREF